MCQHFYGLPPLIFIATCEITIITPILQMRLAQGQTAGKWWSHDLNPDCLALESVLMTVLYYTVFLGSGHIGWERIQEE